MTRGPRWTEAIGSLISPEVRGEQPRAASGATQPGGTANGEKHRADDGQRWEAEPKPNEEGDADGDALSGQPRAYPFPGKNPPRILLEAVKAGKAGGKQTDSFGPVGAQNNPLKGSMVFRNEDGGKGPSLGPVLIRGEKEESQRERMRLSEEIQQLRAT